MFFVFQLALCFLQSLFSIIQSCKIKKNDVRAFVLTPCLPLFILAGHIFPKPEVTSNKDRPDSSLPPFMAQLFMPSNRGDLFQSKFYLQKPLPDWLDFSNSESKTEELGFFSDARVLLAFL